MYSVYADGVCIYNDAFALYNMKLASPKLTLEDSAALWLATEAEARQTRRSECRIRRSSGRRISLSGVL